MTNATLKAFRELAETIEAEPNAEREPWPGYEMRGGFIIPRPTAEQERPRALGAAVRARRAQGC